MDYKQLRYLVEITERGSINRAAAYLRQPESTLSIGILKLENELGIKILNRTSVGITLTNDGDALYKNSKEILSYINKINNNAVTMDEHILKDAKLNPLTSKSIINDDLSNEDKHINIYSSEKSYKELVNKVKEEKVDMGLILILESAMDEFLDYLEDKDIEFVNISKNNIFAYVGKSSTLYEKKDITKNDLIGLNLITSDTEEDTIFHDIEGYLTLYNSNAIINSLNTQEIVKTLKIIDSFCIGTAYTFDSTLDYEIKRLPIIDIDNKIILGYIKKRSNSLSADTINYINLLSNLNM